MREENVCGPTFISHLTGRLTVLVPALLACRRVFFGGSSPEKGDLMLLGSLMQPALLLIDHGHFQYNSISLGLAVSLYPDHPWPITLHAMGSAFGCLS